MVVQEDSERPTEVPMIREPVLLRPSRYVLVRNHVRELAPNEQTDQEDDPASDSEPKKKKKKEGPKKMQQNDQSFDDSSEHPSVSNVIASDEETKDFEELQKIYYECKRILNKIEQKYGDKLNLNENSSNLGVASNQMNKQKHGCRNTEGSRHVCTCERNKKIVFDASGNETVTSPERTDHICIPNPRPAYSREDTKQEEYVRIAYETSENELETAESILPDDVSELASILQRPQLAARYRDAVVRKLRVVKQDLLFDLKYQKSSLMEILKEDPDQLLDFRGTNLADLMGYS